MRMFRVWRFVVLVSLCVLSACGATTAVSEPATATVVIEPATAVSEPATATAVTEPATATAVTEPATATAVTDSATASPNQAQTLDVQTRAVQTLLDYYGAIIQKKYDVAYKALETPSQTLAQFTAQYENNIDSRLWVGAPQVDGDVVTIAVTVVTGVNQTTADQAPQWTNETYTIKDNKITNAVIVAATQKDEPAPDQLIVKYYDARKNFQLLPMAYTLWQYNGGASALSYAKFVNQMTAIAPNVFVGEAQTDAGAGSMDAIVPVVEVYGDADSLLKGDGKVFCGTYSLRSSNVPPVDQFGWQITESNMNPVTISDLKLDKTAELNVPIFQKLLTSGCTP